MDSDVIQYKCLSGRTLFIYNKKTGELIWPTNIQDSTGQGSVISTMLGEPVLCKEYCTTGTQTDDTGCDKGCTSMYINVSSTESSKEIPTQQKPDVVEKVKDHSDVEFASHEDHGSEDEEREEPERRDIGEMVTLNIVGESDCNNSDLDNVETTDNFAQGKTNGFKCGQCKETFICKSHLQNHLKVHSEERLFECSYCQRKFRGKKTLKGHLRTHTGEKTFECSHCQKKFRRKETLKDHLRTHTGEKPFECSYCKNKFRHKKTLNEHLRTHTGEKPFECSYCKIIFRHLKTLKDHIRTHTGEKPFECSHCKKKFAQNKYLKVHLKIHTR